MRSTVLIVEDVDTVASTLEIAFSSMPDVDVSTAASGEQAWRLIEARTRPLAAIVTDLEMRGMDGFELIERVRAHPLQGSVPIIVITGSSDPEAPDRVRQLGGNAFFIKPYSPVLVREKLEQLLNHDMPKS
jgi:CheY-like chemotaxis protein